MVHRNCQARCIRECTSDLARKEGRILPVLKSRGLLRSLVGSHPCYTMHNQLSRCAMRENTSFQQREAGSHAQLKFIECCEWREVLTEIYQATLRYVLLLRSSRDS